MTGRLSPEWRTRLSWLIALPAVLVLLLQLGRMAPHRPELAGLVALTVLALGLSLAEPAIIPLLAMPALVVSLRVGGEGLNLSVSDAALFAALWPAVFLGKRPYSPPMRALLWLSAAYQAATLFTVIANPFLANTVEWFHAWLLISGGLIVGWAVGRAGYAAKGLTLLLLAGVVIALSTIVQGAIQVGQGELGPVYPTWPFEMHKNFVGTVLAFLAVVAYTRPPWLRWGRAPALTAFWLFVAGIVFSQSRQGLVALAAALVVVSMRRDPELRRSRIILLAVAPALVAVGTAVRDEIATGNVHYSVLERLSWYEDTWTIWERAPVFGVGLRYWVAGRVEFNVQPPNAEMEMLASAGVLGLAGFVVLFGGALLVLWRVPARYGTLAFAVLLARVVQGQFDLFWIAVQASVPFVVIGICLGVQAFEAEEQRLVRPVDAGERVLVS